MTRFLPIGQILISDGLVTRAQVEQALADQEREGGSVGMHLLLRGAVTRRQTYAALARQWSVPLIDLHEVRPDPHLLADADPKVLLGEGWVPVSLEDGQLVIATCVAPEPELLELARLRYRAREVVVRATTDWDVHQAVSGGCRVALLYSSADELAEVQPEHSARRGALVWQRYAVTVLLVALALGLAFVTVPTMIALLVVINLMFLAGVTFKIAASIAGVVARVRRRAWRLDMARERMRRGLPPVGRERVADRDLPRYTILVPAFHEANIVEKVIDNIGGLDYPKSRLQVLVLIEEDDAATLAAAKAARPPEYVRILVVPEGTPQTKPRACNFGLLFSTGEYLVIYDAEDHPDPGQLRAALAAFAAEDEASEREGLRPVACLQAALNYSNITANVLTRMFTLEYSFWFDAMLPGLEAFGFPVPLGGTSNHFRTGMLRQLGGWDPYNVTEDADLGLRASAAGYRIAGVDSTTWEEACSKTPAWIRQRTRWIKGYLVTAMVNLRHPWRYTRAAGFRGMAGLLGLIAGTPLMFLAYPVVFLLTLLTYVGFATGEFPVPGWVLTAATLNMLIGNVSMIVASGLAGWHRHGWRVAMYALLNPAYWCLHAWAAWRALWQLIWSPFHWEKTPHGLSHAREEVAPVH